MSLRLLLAGLVAGAILLGQQTTEQSSSSWTLDASGHRVEGPQITAIENAAGSQRSETLRSANGRMVPVQTTEEKVLNPDPNNKVVERVIRKYDANGNPAQSIRIRIEQKKNPDGSTTIQSVSSQSDVNGSEQVFERAMTQIRKGAATETSTTVERATVNGFQTVERDMRVERPTAGGSQVDATVYRRDVNGSFAPFAQDTQQISKSGADVSTDAAHYEVGPDGKLALYSRSVDRTRTNPDGTQVTDTDVYSRFSHDKTADINAAQPRLQEQVHRETAKGSNGELVETVSVRGRLPLDPSRFGTLEKVSETKYTITDSKGRTVVQSGSETVSRRDLNGNIVVDQGRSEQNVPPKD